jgi:hypothetical protein
MVRISFVEWEMREGVLLYVRDYTQTWKNFCETDEQYRMHSIQTRILDTEYNAFIEDNDIVFATEEDAVMFLLRWS